MNLQVVRLGPDRYRVRNVDTMQELTVILPEHVARLLAEAERAIVELEHIIVNLDQRSHVSQSIYIGFYQERRIRQVVEDARAVRDER